MAQETLFRILTRQPWWVSLLVAMGMFGLAQTLFPPVAPFVALPFIALTGYIGYTQWRTGSLSNPTERLAELRSMSWETFSAAVTKAYQRQKYQVAPSAAQGFDFTLTKDGRVTLLQCRRWRVNQVGAGPVKELAVAVERENASRGICLAAGDFSAPARKVAATEPITLVSGTDLVQLVGKRMLRDKKFRWFGR